MTPNDFIVLLSETYNEPIVRQNNTPNLKLKFIKQWAEENFDNSTLDIIAEKLIKGFIPTSTNPCPLIPHIIEICEIDTTEKSKSELALSIANRMIWAYFNIGYDKEGCSDRALEHMGNLGAQVLMDMYGRWYSFCRTAEDTDIEYLRKSLKDSILSHINRVHKGIDTKTPEIEDLGHNGKLKAIEG